MDSLENIAKSLKKGIQVGALSLATLYSAACGGSSPSGPNGGNPVPYNITAPIIGNVSGNLGSIALSGVVGTASTVNKSDISSKVPNMYGSEIYVAELNGTSIGRSVGRGTNGSTSYTVSDAAKQLAVLVLETVPGANYECAAITDGATFNKNVITISRGSGNIYGNAAPNAVVQDGTSEQWQEWKDNLTEANEELAVGGYRIIDLQQQADFSNSDIKYGFIGGLNSGGNHSFSGNAISVDIINTGGKALSRKKAAKEELAEALAGPQLSVDDWGRKCGDNYTDSSGKITPIAKALTTAAAFRTPYQ